MTRVMQRGRCWRRDHKPAAVIVVSGDVAGVRRSITGERARRGEIGAGQAIAKGAVSWSASCST